MRNNVFGVLLNVPNTIQVHLSEAVAIMAKYDFPQQWPELVANLASSLDPQATHKCHAVLTTAHLLFKRYRHEHRTDDLFLEIIQVLQGFAAPFLNCWKVSDQFFDQR